MKPFDQGLHDKFDAKAKRAVLGFCNSLPENGAYDYVTANPDKYGIDLLAIKSRKVIFGIDVEVKTAWRWDDFPFPTVNIPARKEKFFSKGENPPNYFFILNNTCERAIILKDTLITEDMGAILNNRFMKGERFFQVPIELSIRRKLSTVKREILSE